jgi:HK97 gp10 family phage protein
MSANRNKSLTDQSRDLENALNGVLDAVILAVRPALITSGEEVAATMRTLAEASRDTGALIDSIVVTGPGETTPAYAAGGGKRTAKVNQVLITVGNEQMRHGHFVEFGTVKVEAQPFMRPSIRLNKLRFQRRIARAGTTAISKVLKK